MSKEADMSRSLDSSASLSCASTGELRGGTEMIDSHLWGFLEPCHTGLTRIDFWKIHPAYTFGRGTNENHVVLPGLKISFRHCIITWDGVFSLRGGIRVKDLSSNGTFINGEKISKGKTRLLNHGNEIAFGTTVHQPHNGGLEDYRFIYHHCAGASAGGLLYKYDLGTDLGRGAFATVYKAVNRDTGEYYAVKMIAAPVKTLQASRGKQAAREIDVMRELIHPNICQLVEVFSQEDGSLNLVLELVEGGNLLQYTLKTNGGIKEKKAKDLVHQLCTAMAYIHSKGITHRDLKLENVLLTKDDPPIIKVADFGLAKEIDDLTLLRTMCGTPHYLAPEVITRKASYNNLVDSWSAGVIVFCMLTRNSPFVNVEDHKAVHAYILGRTIDWTILENNPRPISLAAKQFIGLLLEHDPSHRMSMTDSLQHEWIFQDSPNYEDKAADSDGEISGGSQQPEDEALTPTPSIPGAADHRLEEVLTPVPDVRVLRRSNRHRK